MVKGNSNPVDWEKSGIQEFRERVHGFEQITASPRLSFLYVKWMEGPGGENQEMYQLPGSE